MGDYAPGNPYRDATLPSMLGAQARRLGSREALVAGDRRLSYADLEREVARCAHVPRTPGPHGDKVQRTQLREDARRRIEGGAGATATDPTTRTPGRPEGG